MSDARMLAAGHVMVRVDASEWHSTAYRSGAYRLIDQGVCGIGVFLGNLEDTAVMIEELQRRAGGSLLVAADYEFGLPMRLEGGISYPRAMALGKCSAETTESIASLIAHEAHALGVHWNWAPVADINSNPDNPIINTRSFGEDPLGVAEQVNAYVRGTQAQAVLACVKHFPGHGDTTVDSHVALPTIDVSEDTAAVREFVPFTSAIASGVGSVMVGHIVVPFLDAQLPASLSHNVITGLLRGRMGFDGLVCTDALDMHAIADRWPSGEAAVLALEAGADIALMPDDVEEAITAIAQAIESGRLSQEHLDASRRRIDSVKQTYVRGAARTSNHHPHVVDQSTHAMFALKAADEAQHVAGNSAALPITRYQHVAALAVVSDADMASATTWFQALTQAVEMNIDCGYIDGSISDREVEDLAHGLAEADVLVLALFGKAIAYRGSLPGGERVPEIAKRLAAGRPVIVVACGSPYGIDRIDSACTIYTYSDTLPSIAASVMRLIGRNVR
jgi:beta-glucosidase-like glycosyl hydrolase